MEKIRAKEGTMMFRKVSDGLRRLMYGRYGMDQLNFALMIGSILLLIGGIWVRILTIPAYGVLGFYLFRCYSRNIYKRKLENSWFLRVITPIKDRKNRYFKCPGCRQIVRVPKGKGKIKISCPKCGRKFEKIT